VRLIGWLLAASTLPKTMVANSNTYLSISVVLLCI
jgi:hypothetical protein